jgi:capsular exopolysaccharide synthesis family protein
MSQEPEAPREESRVQLREYLSILWVRKWTILIVTLLVVGAALGFSARQVPMYRSEARFLVKPASISGEIGPPASVNMETEKELLASTPVAQIVTEKANLEAGDPRGLLAELEVQVVPGTEILLIQYEAPDPVQARDLANHFAKGYAQFRREELLQELEAASKSIREKLEQLQIDYQEAQDEAKDLPPGSAERDAPEAKAASIQSQITAYTQDLNELVDKSDIQVGDVIQPAFLPTAPVSPDYVRNGILALVLGLLLGVGLAFLRERLDDRLRGRADLEEHIGAPVLAVIPRVSSWRRKAEAPVVTVTEPRSAPSEAYRTLRTSLLFAASQRDAKTILITSPHAGEGKTATSANLAVVLAQARKRVLLISADLRKPRLHRFFRVPNDVGLTSVLIGDAKPWEAVVDVGFESLKLVPSGPVPGNPAELLGSDAMGTLLAQFREVADFVLLDSAPALVVADSLTLAPFVDAALFVADAENTNRGAVMHARNQLEQVNVAVIGAALNNFDPSKARTSPYYYSYYYTYKYEEVPRQGRLRRRRVGTEEGPYPVGGARPTGFESGREPVELGGPREEEGIAGSGLSRLWAPEARPDEPPAEQESARDQEPTTSSLRRGN